MSEDGKFLWLSMGDLKAVNEREIIAAQDQVVHRKSMSINVQQDATIQFILSVRCSTCFGRFLHPSSEHK